MGNKVGPSVWTWLSLPHQIEVRREASLYRQCQYAKDNSCEMRSGLPHSVSWNASQLCLETCKLGLQMRHAMPSHAVLQCTSLIGNPSVGKPSQSPPQLDPHHLVILSDSHSSGAALYGGLCWDQGML